MVGLGEKKKKSSSTGVECGSKDWIMECWGHSTDPSGKRQGRCAIQNEPTPKILSLFGTYIPWGMGSPTLNVHVISRSDPLSTPLLRTHSDNSTLQNLRRELNWN